MEGGINLRGLVVSNYGSVSSFAREIGWCNSKAYRIVSGKQEPDVTEIKGMVQLLNITDPAVVVSIFLS